MGHFTASPEAMLKIPRGWRRVRRKEQESDTYCYTATVHVSWGCKSQFLMRGHEAAETDEGSACMPVHSSDCLCTVQNKSLQGCLHFETSRVFSEHCCR